MCCHNRCGTEKRMEHTIGNPQLGSGIAPKAIKGDMSREQSCTFLSISLSHGSLFAM